MEDSSEPKKKKKRNLPGTPDPEAEVIALSPRTLMATNRFSCDVCGKGFQRDQNLQLHRRGHNLPWKLKQREGQEIKKKVYVCPEILCVHHDPSRALGDLTGIKKHFSRKHGEKKWKCEKCLKSYAVQSDWKAHKKVCGTREYRCDCGTLFSRRDSFITHRAFCGALAEENAKSTSHKKVDSQESDNGWDENTPPSGRTKELSSTFNAPSTPSQLTCSPSTVEVGEPPIKESFTTPSVKEGFKQASTNENFKQCPIKQHLEPGSVEEVFKQSPLKEVLEEPLCTLEESGISSVSPKCIQDGREAHSHKTNEVMNIRRISAELDDIGTSTMSPKWQQNVEDRSKQAINSGFKHCNNPLDGNGISSSSPKWVEDSVTQNYKPIRNFKLPDSSLDINKMTSLSVPPKWMQNAINEQAYKPSGGLGEPNYGSNESQIPSVSPKWIPDGIEQMEKSNKGPTPLSLSLGCGPSPGASSKSYRAKPFEEMNDVATALHLESEHRNQWPSLSHDSDTFTRMLTSSNNSANNNTDSSEPHHTIYYKGPLRNNGAGETLAYGNTIGSQSYLCGNPSKPFNNNHHRYNTTKGQMPATALLQKAAMMGSTSSNRYLLRNFGLRGSNTLSNMVSAGSGKDSWAGSSVSSMWAGGFTAISPTTGANNVDRSSREGGAYVRASIHDGIKTGVQGSSRASAIDASSLSTNLNNPMDAIHGHDQMLLFGKSKVSNNSTILAGLEEIQRTDKHGGDKMTLDLLGVGSHGMGVKERTFSFIRRRGLNSSSPCNDAQFP